MTPDWITRNLALYSAQIAIVIAACGALVFAVRLRSPAARLAYWHVVLAVCLAMPVLEVLRHPAEPDAAGVTFSSTPLTYGGARDPASKPVPWLAIGLGAIALGTILRLAWLGAGFVRLRRYRRAAAPLEPLPDSLACSCADLRVFPEFLISDDVISPVTFGLRRPVILFPASFLDLNPAAQQTVACHELLHVARKDWCYTIAEEAARALLWFHPAIWWLLGQAQLAREQAVDDAVIQRTNLREEYLSAILAIASGGYQPDLAPATLFLKKRHLKERVAAIVKGAGMSRKRMILSMIAVLSMLPATVGIVAWQIPLLAAPQVVGQQDSPGIEVRTGPYKLLHRSGVEYAPDALAGDVVVSVTVDANGEVTDARIVSGPEPQRRAVLQSVLGWHFSTETPLPPTFEVSVRFLPGEGPKRIPGAVAPAPPPQAAGKTFTVKGFDLSGVPESMRSAVQAAMPLREGDVIDWNGLRQAISAVKRVDSHIELRGSLSDGIVHLTLVPPGATVISAESDRPTPQRIRVGGNVQANNLVHKVQPAYPPLARQARIQGTVRFTATIGKDGHIIDLSLVSGHPLLVPAATEAVQQWIYRPTLLNGNPIEVVTVIDINFTLSDGPPLPAQ
jgi:TonB family protein